MIASGRQRAYRANTAAAALKAGRTARVSIVNKEPSNTLRQAIGPRRGSKYDVQLTGIEAEEPGARRTEVLRDKLVYNQTSASCR